MNGFPSELGVGARNQKKTRMKGLPDQTKSLPISSAVWRPPYNFGMNRDIRFKFGRDIDHKATQKWAWPGSRDQISKLWDPPYNFWVNRDICFKFGTDIDDGTDPYCVRTTKRPLSGRGLGHVTQFRNFGTPPYNFWTNRAIRFKFGTDIDDAMTGRTPSYCVRTTKRPVSGRGLGHVTQFRNFGTPNNFWTNIDIRFKFGTDIENAPLRRANHKMTPKWAWPGSHDQISKFWDPLITFERIEISASNLAQT